MSISISLVSIPKEGQELLKKAKRKGRSDEYSSIFFFITRAFDPDFCTYGHKDWIEFKTDVSNLQQYYPAKKFESKYQFDTNSKYEVIEYLIAKHQNRKFKENKRIELSFFKGNEECICQGRNFEYWDNTILKKKLALIDSINKTQLFNHFNLKVMKEFGVYKLGNGKDEKKNILNLIEELTVFLRESVKLKGYTLILQL